MSLGQLMSLLHNPGDDGIARFVGAFSLGAGVRNRQHRNSHGSA
jgi:hypothetical protein